jgi:hypothetical protein
MTKSAAPATTKLRGLYHNWVVGEVSVASGGQATLYDIPGTPYIYKRFKKAPRHQEQLADLTARLRELAAFGYKTFVREEVSIGATAAASFSWPVDVIEEDRVPVGVVMPKAGSPFYRDARSLRTLEYLYLYRCHPPDALTRVAVLIRILRAFDLLASMQLVHGDLAPKNIVWSADPRPAALVLDVDGLHKHGADYWDYVQTFEWEDPRVSAKSIPGHDLYSDWYAISLLVMRVLLCARLISRVGADARKRDHPPLQLLPDPVAAPLERLFIKHLDVTLRPSPRQWATVLSTCFFPNNKPSVEALIKVDLAVAQWRRLERRSGNLGPPFTDIRPYLI